MKLLHMMAAGNIAGAGGGAGGTAGSGGLGGLSQYCVDINNCGIVTLGGGNGGFGVGGNGANGFDGSGGGDAQIAIFKLH